MKKTFNFIPKGGKLCVTYTTEKGQIYYITQNKEKDKYTLWKEGKQEVEKIKTASSPVLLEKAIE